MYARRSIWMQCWISFNPLILQKRVEKPLRDGRKDLILFPDQIQAVFELWFQWAERQTVFIARLDEVLEREHQPQPFAHEHAAVIGKVRVPGEAQLVRLFTAPAGNIRLHRLLGADELLPQQIVHPDGLLFCERMVRGHHDAPGVCAGQLQMLRRWRMLTRSTAWRSPSIRARSPAPTMWAQATPGASPSRRSKAISNLSENRFAGFRLRRLTPCRPLKPRVEA